MKNNNLLKAIILFMFLAIIPANAQNTLEAPKGYSDKIGTTVAMLENIKGRIERGSKKLTQEQTDYLLLKDANRIGAMILHLAATEKYYQLYTFEGREFNDKEIKEWGTALDLGDKARSEFVGKTIEYYLKIWDDVRKETLRLLKTKDDKWFKEMNNGMTNEFAWFHVMEHQSNHMGQINMIINRLPK